MVCSMACEWHKRLSLPVPEAWEKVLAKLSPLPVEEDVYITYEGIPDMWTNFAFEHPALIGTFGMLPGDGVDQATLAPYTGEDRCNLELRPYLGMGFPDVGYGCRPVRSTR